jgi:hypothetical protein
MQKGAPPRPEQEPAQQDQATQDDAGGEYLLDHDETR